MSSHEIVPFEGGFSEDEAKNFEHPFTGDDLRLYRELVAQMENDFRAVPGMETAVALAIRMLARDYIISLWIDKAAFDNNVPVESVAKQQNLVSDRMLSLMRMITNLAAKADLAAAWRAAFITGVITETVRVMALVDDVEERRKLMEGTKVALKSYVTQFEERYGK